MLHGAVLEMGRKVKKHSASRELCMQTFCSLGATYCDRSKQTVSSQQDSNKEEAEETITHRDIVSPLLLVTVCVMTHRRRLTKKKSGS